MGKDRLIRVNALLRREIAEALFQVMNESGFDLSSVTITHVICSSNLRQARVLVSIREHQDERARMLRLLDRHRGRIQEMINRDLTIKYTPRLTFELDTSLEDGDRVLRLLSEMDIPESPPEGDPDEGEPHE